jgi:hypothetical protein
MQWLWNRGYSHCLLLEEEHPLPPLDWQGAIDILDPNRTPAAMLDDANVATLIDGLPPPMPPARPGSVPATDPADAPVDAPAAPKAKATKTASTDQPLCSRHGLRTVYSGKRWNCRK